jgi:hypothetical protein
LAVSYVDLKVRPSSIPAIQRCPFSSLIQFNPATESQANRLVDRNRANFPLPATCTLSTTAECCFDRQTDSTTRWSVRRCQCRQWSESRPRASRYRIEQADQSSIVFLEFSEKDRNDSPVASCRFRYVSMQLAWHH